MFTTLSKVNNISVSGLRSFFDSIDDLLHDLKEAGLPIDEELKEPSVVNEDDQEGLIEIELDEPINRVDAALISVVRAPESNDPTIQKLKIKKGVFGPNTHCVMLSINHPRFGSTLRQEVENLTGKLH